MKTPTYHTGSRAMNAELIAAQEKNGLSFERRTTSPHTVTYIIAGIGFISIVGAIIAAAVLLGV